MPLRPLFTEQELATAFTLLLPQKDATRTARRWFATMTSAVVIDEGGSYLAEESDWRLPGERQANVVVTNRSKHNPTSGGYEQLRDQSVLERVNFLLHLSHFHLHLVMLVSEVAFNRIAAFLEYDLVRAGQVREQMKLIVKTMGVPSN